MGRFYFEDDTGQRIDLQSDEYIAVEVSGLGTSNEGSYIKMGHTFTKNYLDLIQSEISFGVVCVPPRAYDKLQSLSQFLNCALSLYLIYVPSTTESVEYRRDVDILEFQQDTSVTGLLRYKVVLSCKSLFYTNDTNSFVIERATGEFRYNYTFPARFNDNSVRDVVIENTGHVEASFMIEFEGYTDTPKMRVFVDGTEVYSISFDLVIDVGGKLRYSTQDGNLELSHINADGTEVSLINQMDLEKEIFYKLPIGRSRVQFTSENGLLSKLHFNVYQYYKVV